jgi:phosphoglycolate phosphatase-like HAD superfamily hydrolase
MIGDGLTDIQAGRDAGCRTVLIGRMRCELCQKMDELDIRPDFVVSDLFESISKICQ